MMKKMLLFASIVLMSGAKAQVGVGTSTPDVNTVIDMSGIIDKGFLGPKVKLQHPTSIAPFTSIEDGVVVYNEEIVPILDDIDLTKGYYVWSNYRWIPLSAEGVTRTKIESEINIAVLGYFPEKNMNQTPAKLTIADATVTKEKCVKFTKTVNVGNDHGYCSYTFDRTIFDETINAATTYNFTANGMTWMEAFNFAKSLGGYLVTITDDSEWSFIKNNFLTSTDPNIETKPKSTDNIWIGYNKVAYPGNLDLFTWVTGERSLINWGDPTIQSGGQFYTKVQDNFPVTEPNNWEGNEGCSHIWNTWISTSNSPVKSNHNTARPWNDINCQVKGLNAGNPNTGDRRGGRFDYLIVEFQPEK